MVLKKLGTGSVLEAVVEGVVVCLREVDVIIGRVVVVLLDVLVVLVDVDVKANFCVDFVVDVEVGKVALLMLTR